jgi:uncharacterized protein
MKKFHSYLLVRRHAGGCSEVCEEDPVYESILTVLRDDVSKYASAAKVKYIQHIIEHASKYVGLQIKYEKFGESNFRSREMSEALTCLKSNARQPGICINVKTDAPDEQS